MYHCTINILCKVLELWVKQSFHIKRQRTWMEYLLSKATVLFVHHARCFLWFFLLWNICKFSTFPRSLQYKEAWSKTSIRWGGVKTFVNKRWMVCRTVMIRCALESSYLGQPFKYLERHHITHRKIFRATWSQKVRQKLMKTQKFRESQLALKNKILSFARFLRLSSTSTLLNVLIWCALDSSALKQPFKYFKRQHINHWKIFRDIWSQNAQKINLVCQSQLRLSEFLSFHQFLAHFLTLAGSKNFSMGDMLTFKVFEELF